MSDDDMTNYRWWYDYLLYYSCIPIYVMMWILTPLLLFMCFGVCTLGVQILRTRSFSFAGRLEGGDRDILLKLFYGDIK